MFHYMINIGINGFGRIGKCIFLQLIANSLFMIRLILFAIYPVLFFPVKEKISWEKCWGNY